MPFRSKAAMAYLFSQKPDVAHKIARDAGMSHLHKTKKSKAALKQFRALPYHSKTKAAVRARRNAPASVKRKRKSAR